MDSFWFDGVTMPTFPPLEQSKQTDVLVIGGGITGILCAYALQSAGIDTIVVEAKRICSGITGNTTAKITAQHGLIYDKLLRKFGVEKAGLYLKCNLEALEKYRNLCKDIPCDFESQDAFLYTTENTAALMRELEALHRIGYSIDLLEKIPLPFPTACAIRFNHQAQFHPLKFLAHLAKNLTIYENTKVIELMPGIARTNHGTIHAKAMIVTTHFPMLNKHGSYFLKLYQQRSYVLGLKNTGNLDGMYIGTEYPNLSFRTQGDLLLLGGCGHRTGKNGGGWQELSYYAHRYYPKSQALYRWATQDCMSLDGLPYIGQYSKNTPNLYVATGFQKWGMTSAMAAAQILRDMIAGKENPYADLFSPSRSILHPQLAINGFETISHLLRFHAPRCPHMGCALNWNPQERSWDCACHGSRFSECGQLLDNPATDDKHFKKEYKKRSR